jgi:2-amino-4-hydroxy-6-hydroxymethyldihydropteridine diphosphokinase
MSVSPSGTVDAFIAVGSNIEPERHVVAALRELLGREPVVGCSTFYATAPLDRPDQGWFANGVWKVATRRQADELKRSVLTEIERQLGRVRTADPHAARTVDLDLIIYGTQVIERDGLVIPDPDIRRRAFIAVPLLELAPELVLPDTGEALASLPVAQRHTGLQVLDQLTHQLKGMIEQ